MTDPGGAPQGESDADAARRRRGAGYARRLHLEFIGLLAVITVVFGYLGWTWRPQSSGFPAIPQGMTIHVDAPSVVAREVLTRTADDGAVLELFLHGDTSTDVPTWSEHSWVVTIYHLGSGRLCPPKK